MSISPRTLRPSSTFSPRSISGLALWLDASDSATLFQNSDGTVPATATSDPVGYWGDKSGNGRHAVQATAGSRPTISATAQNGRKALTLDGSNDWLRATPSTPVGESGFTIMGVVKNNLTSQPLYLSPPLNLSLAGSSQGRPFDRWQGGSNQSIFAIGVTGNDVGTAAGAYRALDYRYVYSLDALKDGISSGTHQVREFINGATNFTASNAGFWNVSSQSLNVGARGDAATLYKGDICELFLYDRRLTTTERQRVERYLAARWGITLAPTVANADAQDWINRVYANGGTVSSATAGAVNTFCESIASAGIRDRFLRLNLFCGSFQGAFVPLFRGPSLGGTQYGNATDTNLGSPSFLITDYSESNGLQAMTAAQAAGATAATKHLNCGAVFAGLASHADSHIAADIKLHTGATYAQMPIIQVFADSVPAESYFSQHRLSLTAARTLEHISGGTSQINRASLPEGVRHFVLSSRTNLSNFSAYLNGGSAISGGSIASRSVSTTAELAPFGQWNAGPAPAYRHIMSAYSFGRGFSTGEAIAYSNAMAAFKVAMGRT